MKKKCLFFVVLFFAVIALCSCNGGGDGPSGPPPTPVPIGEENMALTFCAFSDTHMGASNTEESFTKAFEFVKNFNVAPELFLFAGDITESTGKTKTNEEIVKFKELYSKYALPSQMLYCLGSTHDVSSSEPSAEFRELFFDTFGSEYYTMNLEPEEVMKAGIQHIQYKGYNFFCIDYELDTSDGAPAKVAMKYLREQLAIANEQDSEKPIFVIMHVPNTTSVVNVMKEYPQIVCFTGHIHNSLAREDAISQEEGYTHVHCGGMNYYRVNGYDRFTEDPYLNLGDIDAFGHGLYVQVDSQNNVTINRVDMYNGVVLNNPWEVGPERRDVYTRSRMKDYQKCRFEADDVLSIVEVGDDELIVSWDACTSGEAGSPLYYQAQVYMMVGDTYKVMEHEELSSQQVFFPNDQGIPSLHYSFHFKGLIDTSDYAIVVTAQDCWKRSENALFYTNGSYVSKYETTGQVKISQQEK